MELGCEAGRLLTYQAAIMKGEGKRYTKQAAMAKLFTSEHAMKTTTKALQMFGGYGYTKDYPMERMMRDAKITEIYEGTSEVQRIVISNNMADYVLLIHSFWNDVECIPNVLNAFTSSISDTVLKCLTKIDK